MATLGVSITGMLSLLALKRWELATGHVVGGRARPALGALAHRALTWAEYALPALFGEWVRRAARYLRGTLHRLAALVVVLFERFLERTLRVVRRKTQVPPGEVEASAFLREVSAHKKELLKGTRKRAIYED